MLQVYFDLLVKPDAVQSVATFLSLSLYLCVWVCSGLERDGRSSSAMAENEALDEEEDDDEDEGGAETEEQSGNESEMNDQEEEVTVL